MASRYWVGGTDSWDATAGTKWALTSGGAGGQAVPTSSDNVFMDANSGASTVSIATTATCLTLDTTGFTGTLNRTSGGIIISGSLVIGATITSFNPNNIAFNSTSSGNTITSNGKSVANPTSITFNGVGGVWTLQDTFSMSGNFTVTNGSFITNGQTLTTFGLSSSNSNVRTIDMSNSVWNCVGSGTWNVGTATNLTLTTTNSILNLDTSGIASFVGGGKTYNIVNVRSNISFLNSATYTLLHLGISRTVTFTAGTTHTITTLTGGGTTGTKGSILSSSAGSAFTLSVASGTVNINYMSIKDCTASGGATFNAYNSTNVSGNTGWNFLTFNQGGFFSIK